MAGTFVRVAAAPEAPGVVQVIALDEEGRIWSRHVFSLDRGAPPTPWTELPDDRAAGSQP